MKPRLLHAITFIVTHSTRAVLLQDSTEGICDTGLNEPSCSHDTDSQRGLADSTCDSAQHYDSHVPKLSSVRLSSRPFKLVIIVAHICAYTAERVGKNVVSFLQAHHMGRSAACCSYTPPLHRHVTCCKKQHACCSNVIISLKFISVFY